MEVTPEPNLLNKSLLEDAWRLFSIYDRSAIETQKRFLCFRVLILIFVVVATILVVIKTQVFPLAEKAIENMTISNIFNTWEGILYGTVIMSPIAVSVLLFF